jgi:IS30 family transposase
MQQLTVTQRYPIQILLEEGLSIKRISEKISVHCSTIYRGINRNSEEGIIWLPKTKPCAYQDIKVRKRRL